MSRFNKWSVAANGPSAASEPVTSPLTFVGENSESLAAVFKSLRCSDMMDMRGSTTAWHLLVYNDEMVEGNKKMEKAKAIRPFTAIGTRMPLPICAGFGKDSECRNIKAAHQVIRIGE